MPTSISPRNRITLIALMLIISQTITAMDAAPRSLTPALTHSWLEKITNTARYSWFWLNESRSIISGLWQLFQLPVKKVTIIGGSRMKSDNYYYQQAARLTELLAQNNIGVISGGGPGIMQAAAEGTKKYHHCAFRINLGIGVQGLEKELGTANERYSRADNFEIRQWLLFNFSCTVVAFPGGIGTLYELTQVLTLLDTKQMASSIVVLFDRKHWQPFIDWLHHLAYDQKLISPTLFTYIKMVDSVEEVFDIINKSCYSRSSKRPFNLLI